MELTQRHLVNRRLRLKDGEVVTKYSFPFWDKEWHVAFYVVDRLGKTPAILHPPLHEEKNGPLTSASAMADLRDLVSVAETKFRELYHYDPWWVFRGMGGVSDEMKHAIIPTNIAKPFRWKEKHWKVHDVVIGEGGTGIVAIVAKNEAFERREFTGADLDLATTWPKSPAQRR